MAELKTKPSDDSVDAYLGAVAAPARLLHEMVARAARSLPAAAVAAPPA